MIEKNSNIETHTVAEGQQQLGRKIQVFADPERGRHADTGIFAEVARHILLALRIHIILRPN